ncbi:MAG TPA: crosslink repair DNA glycosylase YcaQ family protein [Ktedonobacterales bacterium]|jgi:ATP-dependent DNA helicase RecG|nr:crosslink repair DNA glycosylase YcaQ family protein [Ktedonobacterales bacterium]
MRTIPERESLVIEFKSDERRLSDEELIAAVVCLTNTEGGHIYVGVEDDGRITGLHSAHQNSTTLAAMIANRTNPPVSVRVTMLIEENKTVASIEVPRSNRLVATSEGLLQRRRIQGDGTPQCVPFYPHEFASRQSDLGMLDYSALPILGATLEDLDPLERERLRQLIERYSGDRTLVGLSDEEIEGALGLVRHEDSRRVPTVAGLLFLGREFALRQHLPTHEVAFQLLSGTEVRVNDFYRTPLLKTFERIMEQFTARIEEQEIHVGLFRVPIPNYDTRSFREAFVNALVHRDYTRLGAVHVRWEQDSISMSNPGGFVEGVTVDNILVTEPRPRNPVLADAVKRIGLAERTGRGVDLIYQGLLRYGRPAPDYRRSSAQSVIVALSGGSADIGLLRLVLNEERRTQGVLPVNSLIALSLLWRERRTDTPSLANAIQRDESVARNTLELLVEAGLVVAHGIKKGRTYTLSPSVYRETGQPEAYVRQAGFDPIQQEQMVLRFVKEHGQISRKDAQNLCVLGPFQATRLLHRLVDAGELRMVGERKATRYVRV